MDNSNVVLNSKKNKDIKIAASGPKIKNSMPSKSGKTKLNQVADVNESKVNNRRSKGNGAKVVKENTTQGESTITGTLSKNQQNKGAAV
jgi:hypothetical protein